MSNLMQNFYASIIEIPFIANQYELLCFCLQIHIWQSRMETMIIQTKEKEKSGNLKSCNVETIQQVGM